MRVSIHRIEGGMAFLRPLHQLVGQEVEYKVPVDFLPSGYGAGEQIEMAFLPDPSRRADLRRNIKELLKDLPKREDSSK